MAESVHAVGDFLSRPRLISTVDIAMSTGPDWGQEFSPWEKLLYDENQVAAMLTPFAFFKGTMKVRIVVTGHPYNMGKLIASYYSGNDGYLEHPVDGLFANPICAKTQMLSRDHAWLDTSTSEGCVLTCPFVYNKPFFDLDQPSDKYADLGKVQIIMPATLRNVNNSTEGVRLSIYAWVEDVELRGSTSKGSSSVLAHQMGEVENSHVISDTATAVADAAGALSDVPVVGRYARAVDVAARAGASVAKAFGFSKPTDHSPITKVQQRDTENMINTNGPSDCTVIAYDAKCEDILDTSIVGCRTQDELSFDYLGNMDHYINTFDLTSADFGIVDVMGVTPCYTPTENSHRVCGPIPLVSRFFSYWWSTIEYTYTFCSSTANRGTYVLAWDPLGTTDFDPGFVNSVTFNLGETNVVKFRVPMMNTPLDTDAKTVVGNGLKSYANGNMLLACLKPVMGISGTSPNVSVVVTARYVDIRLGGFAQPPNYILSQYAAVPQLRHQMFQEESGEAQKVADDSEHDETMVPAHFYGESIRSARALLRSFAYIGSLYCTTSATETAARLYLCTPTLGGYGSDGGFDRVASTGGTFSHATCNLAAVLWSAFTGRSGSTRYKLVIRRDDLSKVTLGPVRVTAAEPSADKFNSVSIFEPGSTSTLGMHTLFPADNVISLQAPTNRKSLYQTYGASENVLKIEIDLEKNVTYQFDVYAAAGEDSNYVCYRGIPMLDIASKNP